MNPGARRLRLASDSDAFERTLRDHGLFPLVRAQLSMLQVNVGKRCNQACHHCHVEAGPRRTEAMSASVTRHVLDWLARSPGVRTLDITGGAPELNPHFRELVVGARRAGREVIDRCNLTILLEPGQQDLAEFLARERVHVIASLPCYGPDNVDAQRGKGVFDKSIRALKLLNGLGYGRGESSPKLDLVYNPAQASLPPNQAILEQRYKEELGSRFGIRFDALLTLANMPIKRFAASLERRGEHATYMSLLVNHFNPRTVNGLMCRSVVSVGFDGRLFDCDFNQMAELPLGAKPQWIWELGEAEALAGTPIATAEHCFGCTAGSGSSCGGALE